MIEELHRVVRLAAALAPHHPDEILQDMRTDEQIVFVRGRKPLRCGRAIYFRRPEMVNAVAENRLR